MYLEAACATSTYSYLKDACVNDAEKGTSVSSVRPCREGASSAHASRGTPPTAAAATGTGTFGGRGLHSSTFQLNLSRFGHTSLCPPV